MPYLKNADHPIEMMSARLYGDWGHSLPSRIAAAAEFIRVNDLNSEWDINGRIETSLLEYRKIAYEHPPNTRRMNITFWAHVDIIPEEIARVSDELEPGKLLCVDWSEIEADMKYGPGC
jgi:hypothetical protein